MRSVTLHKTSCISIYFFKWVFFNGGSTKKQLVDASGCRTFLSGLIGMSVFDILQIPSGSVHICSAWIAPCYKPPPPPLRASAERNVSVVKILQQYSRKLSESIRISEQRFPYKPKNRGSPLYLTLLRPVVSIGTTCYNIMKLYFTHKVYVIRIVLAIQ
jgi:hypothetical protein